MDFGGEGIFGDDKATLEVVATVDENKQATVIDVAKNILRITFVSGETEPEDVDRDSGFMKRKFGGGARCGLAAITADDERGRDIDRACWSVGVDSNDAIVVAFDQAGDLVLHQEMEVREPGRLGGEKIQKIPLWHQCDEFGVGGKVGEVRHADGLATDRDA